jgi:Fe-S-cluster containining protein
MMNEQANKNGTESDGLEDQLKLSNFFMHTELSRISSKMNEIDAFLNGVADLLLKKHIIREEDLATSVEANKTEMIEKNTVFLPRIATRKDDGEATFMPVNCQERMHICKAACCKLHFALTQEEVESGHIKWNLGEPYFIRQKKDGYCVHNDGKGCCNIYENRPSVCKYYSCRNDKRIWKDFEKMELNEEWIGQHLQGGQMVVVNKTL